jgi:hypothetical protein
MITKMSSNNTFDKVLVNGVMTGTTIYATNMVSTNMTGTNLNFTQATGTTLASTNIQTTNMTGTTLASTNIRVTNMTGTYINFTQATGTTLASTTVLAGFGTESIPSVSFQGNTTTGMYYDSNAAAISFTSAGAKKVGISSFEMAAYDADLSLVNTTNGASSSAVNFIKQPGGAVQPNDLLGTVNFQGTDNFSFVLTGSVIQSQATDVWNSLSCPSALTFSTCPDGLNLPTEYMRINPSGLLSLYGTTYYVGRDPTSSNTNTVLGNNCLVNNVNATNNTMVGYNSGQLITTGNQNTFVGSSAGSSSTIGFNNTALGTSAASSLTLGTNTTCIGYDAQPATGGSSNEIVLGNTAITSLRCKVSSISALSDARDKTNLQDFPDVLPIINDLHPTRFTWNQRDGAIVGLDDHGFIAQEVDQVLTQHNAQWANLVSKSNPDRLELTPGRLIPLLVKAIQEQHQIIAEQTNNLSMLKSLILNASSFEELKTKVAEI